MLLLNFLSNNKDAAGPVVATAGHPQCSRPPVSMGRLSYKQDSAQVPRCGHKEHCEFDKNALDQAKSVPFSVRLTLAAC